MAYRFGFAGVLYMLTDTGTPKASTPLAGRPAPGSPTGTPDFQDTTWTEVDNVRDVDMDGTSEKEDVTTRSEAKLGWKAEVATIRDGKLTTSIRWDPGNELFTLFRDAWLFNKLVALLDMDGPIDLTTLANIPNTTLGNQGLVGNFTVEFGIKKPVKGVITVDVSFGLAEYPDWVVVTGTGANAPTLVAATA